MVLYQIYNNSKCSRNLSTRNIKMKIQKITRIKPPKFKVGRLSLNEYEVRKLMVDVANGIQPTGIVITDEEGVSATLQEDGRPDKNLYGFGINSRFTMELIKLERIKQGNAKMF